LLGERGVDEDLVLQRRGQRRVALVGADQVLIGFRQRIVIAPASAEQQRDSGSADQTCLPYH